MILKIGRYQESCKTVSKKTSYCLVMVEKKHLISRSENLPKIRNFNFLQMTILSSKNISLDCVEASQL